MERKQIIAELVDFYASTLDRKSKWYKSDIMEFKVAVSMLNDRELSERYQRAKAYKSTEFNDYVNAEISKMDNQGMFNVKNLKHGNI